MPNSTKNRCIRISICENDLIIIQNKVGQLIKMSPVHRESDRFIVCHGSLINIVACFSCQNICSTISSDIYFQLSIKIRGALKVWIKYKINCKEKLLTLSLNSQAEIQVSHFSEHQSTKLRKEKVSYESWNSIKMIRFLKSSFHLFYLRKSCLLSSLSLALIVTPTI